jgi:uncharacterized protein (TIGR00730 family)
MADLSNICVFCGSSRGFHEKYMNHARELGEELVRQDLNLVYGGANIGLMKVLADTVLGLGGKVIGVMPRRLTEKEIVHSGLSELHVVETMAQRKELMAARSDAFIAMPGGIGTLDELFEALSWNQLGLMHKPVGILNTDGFYDDLLRFLEKAAEEKFLREEHLKNLIVDHSASSLIGRLKGYTYHVAEKWVDRLKEMGY